MVSEMEKYDSKHLLFPIAFGKHINCTNSKYNLNMVAIMVLGGFAVYKIYLLLVNSKPEKTLLHIKVFLNTVFLMEE